MSELLQPGERIVAATNFRDYILVFGDRGTVIRVDYSDEHGFHVYRKV